MKVKNEVFGELERHAPPTAIFATNTSSLSVTEMAKGTKRARRFAGLHFFNPAAVNLLVEVVAGKETSQETVETLTVFARTLGKLPVETADSAGFAVNRFFVPLLNESCRLVDEKIADPATIDAAAKEAFGITMGPFELMNFTGIPIAYHSQESLHKAFGPFYKPSPVLEAAFKDGKPFDATSLIETAKIPIVKDRLLGVTLGISAQLVDEGVATPESVDKGATTGLRWAMGPFALMNKMGTAEALRLVEAVHKTNGTAFRVPGNLEKRGRSNAPWKLSKVALRRKEGVAIVSLDRPEALNALNADVLSDLEAVVDSLSHDKTLRAVVVTGEGRAFAAGADIKQMIELGPLEARSYTAMGQRVFRKVETLPVPVIAAVNGFAFGGGMELAISCDIIIAAENAQFGLPEVGLGLHPGFGGTQRLPRLIGKAKAKELIFTGDKFDARQAERIGLVMKVVPQAELLAAAVELADRIAQNAPVAVSLAKQAIDRGLETDIDSGLALELETAALCFTTDDIREGMRAFIEKRKAAFRGR
jgi:enoyl-CoA hydratase/3-hydroxyacyl-CoA dehydrogenase